MLCAALSANFFSYPEGQGDDAAYCTDRETKGCGQNSFGSLPRKDRPCCDPKNAKYREYIAGPRCKAGLPEGGHISLPSVNRLVGCSFVLPLGLFGGCSELFKEFLGFQFVFKLILKKADVVRTQRYFLPGVNVAPLDFEVIVRVLNRRDFDFEFKVVVSRCVLDVKRSGQLVFVHRCVLSNLIFVNDLTSTLTPYSVNLSTRTELTRAPRMGMVLASRAIGQSRENDVAGICTLSNRRRSDSRAVFRRGLNHGQMRRSAFGRAVPTGGSANPVSSGRQSFAPQRSGSSNRRRPRIMSATDTSRLAVYDKLDEISLQIHHLHGFFHVLEAMLETKLSPDDDSRAITSQLHGARCAIAEANSLTAEAYRVARRAAR